MPNRFLQWTFSLVILGSAGFLVYVMIGKVQSNSPPHSVTTNYVEQADAGMEGFVYRQTDKGLVQWEVEAQKAEIFDSEHRAVLHTVQVKMFGHKGKEMTLHADGGTINTETNEFDLRNNQGPIVIELANGYTIFTPHIHWVAEQQEISTKTPVTIQGHGMTITGIGLVGHLDSEEFTVLANVRVQVAS